MWMKFAILPHHRRVAATKNTTPLLPPLPPTDVSPNLFANTFLSDDKPLPATAGHRNVHIRSVGELAVGRTVFVRANKLEIIETIRFFVPRSVLSLASPGCKLGEQRFKYLVRLILAVMS